MLGISFAIHLLDPLGLYANGMAISTVTVLTTMVAVLLTTPVAYLSWRLIEIRAIAFGKGLNRQLLPTPESAGRA